MWGWAVCIVTMSNVSQYIVRNVCTPSSLHVPRNSERSLQSSQLGSLASFSSFAPINWSSCLFEMSAPLFTLCSLELGTLRSIFIESRILGKNCGRLHSSSTRHDPIGPATDSRGTTWLSTTRHRSASSAFGSKRMIWLLAWSANRLVSWQALPSAPKWRGWDWRFVANERNDEEPLVLNHQVSEPLSHLSTWLNLRDSLADFDCV